MDFKISAIKKYFKIRFAKVKTLCIFAPSFGEAPKDKYNTDF